MNYCDKCGNKIAKDTKFCTECGAKTLTDDFKGSDSSTKRKYFLYETFMGILAILFALTAAANAPGGYTNYSNVTVAYINKTILYLIPCAFLIFLPAFLVGKYILNKKTIARYVAATLLSLAITFLGLIYLSYGVL